MTTALRTLASGRRFHAADDLVVSPTYLPDLVQAALDLFIDGERRLWHLANLGALTWSDLARRAAELAGLDPSGVAARPSASLGLAAKRPGFCALGSERGTLLSDLENALRRYLAECEVSWAVATPERAASALAGIASFSVRGIEDGRICPPDSGLVVQSSLG